MALANMGFKRPKLVSFEGEKKIREEEEEEQDGEPRSSQQGMDACLWYGTTWLLRL